MAIKINSPIVWASGVLFVLFLAAVFFRPLLPVDETRYLTVAWEMHLKNGWLMPLTMNFEPYHHKPPMLFWLINLFWYVLGVSRWAGLIPAVLSSLSVVLLTIKLGQKILPEERYDPQRIALVMLSSVPFLIYSTLVMFDLMLTAFILCAFLCLLTYAEKRKFRYMFYMGILLGLAVLTKGPVAYLYVIFPMLLGPLWVEGLDRPVSWYGDCFAAILISIFPVAAWVVPVLHQSDSQFAFWLLWEQTAGRVSGNFSGAHARPFYFYIPVIFFLFMPWIFFPRFWRSVKRIKMSTSGSRFLACWLIPVFLSFSLISGKQPHYLLPLLPGAILILSVYLQSVRLEMLRKVLFGMVIFGVGGQGLAALSVFKKYDLSPIADYVSSHRDKEWAFAGRYNGEIGFMARMEKPLEIRQVAEIDQWFDTKPDGLAIMRFANREDIKDYQEIMSIEYRGKNLGIFKKP